MYKLKDNVNIKELEKYGFHTFTGYDCCRKEDILYAVRDSKDDRCHYWQYYRVGVDEKNRTFRKSKYRGCGKCLLSMTVTRNDILDILQSGLVERIK